VGDGFNNLIRALAHEFIELLAGAASGGGDTHHGGATVRLRTPDAFHQSALLKSLENASHGAGSNAGTCGEVGESCAFLFDKGAENGALPLAEVPATDFIWPDLSEDAGETLEFLPPFLYGRVVVRAVHGSRIEQNICMSQAIIYRSVSTGNSAKIERRVTCKCEWYCSFYFRGWCCRARGVERAGIKVWAERDVLVQRRRQDKPRQLGNMAHRMAEAGVNIEVRNSDHGNQLILVVDDMEAGRKVSVARTREPGSRGDE